jgi:hypothetical protein
MNASTIVARLPGRRWNLSVLTGVAALVVLALAVPALSSPYWLRSFTTSAIYAIVCAGVGLLYGRVGLASLGQVALLGVGGWITLRVGHAASIPFPFLLLIAGFGTGIIGVLVGLPALRLSGLNLAIVTLMFAAAFGVVFSATGFPCERIPAARRTRQTSARRHRRLLLSLRAGRCRAHVRPDRRTRPGAAGASVGGYAPERGRSARGGG